MEKILGEFGVQPVLLAAQVVNFLVLLFILKKFLYKPILKVLETRKQKIADSLKQAEEIERKLQETSEKAEHIIAKAQEESKKILDETNKTGAQILEDYKKTGAEILQNSNQDAIKFSEIEKAKMMQEIRENLSGLITVTLEKVTGKILSDKERKNLIEREIKNLS